MPNQQSWILCWIFSVVFPSLVPKHIIFNIKVVITDGDPQDLMQTDNAIESCIPNAKRERYGWHIVAQGIDKHVDAIFPHIPTNLINRHKKII